MTLVGDRVAEREFETADAWDGVRAEVIPGKRRVDLYLNHSNPGKAAGAPQASRRYKLVVNFEDIRHCFGCSLDGTRAILLQVSCPPCFSDNSVFNFICCY